MGFRYLGYEESRTVPNVVVDGAANESTVLTLSHWPGAPTPGRLKRDVSAEIAVAYLDEPCDHAPAEVVTNNHFDVDGLVSIFVLTRPELALAHRDLLIDVAEAGDFSRYRDRRAARAAMTIDALASEESDDCTYTEHTDRLYHQLLPITLDVVLDNDAYREHWAAEDAELTASEAAIADGRITIDERPDLDLAIVTIDPDEPARSGHVVGDTKTLGVHPMALHNATERLRILTIHGRNYRFADRYETWVQFQSRPFLPRVDMAALAVELTSHERGAVTWSATPPSGITTTTAPSDESSIDPEIVVAALERYLTDAA
jgi:hypothetical protein